MEKAGLAPTRAHRAAKRRATRDRAALRDLEQAKALAKNVDAKMRGDAPHPAREE